jgi:hypothetical protein
VQSDKISQLVFEKATPETELSKVLNLHIFDCSSTVISHVSELTKTQAVLLFWRLYIRFPPQRLLFNPKLDIAGFLVDEVAMGQISLRVLRLPLPIVIPHTASNSSVIQHFFRF